MTPDHLLPESDERRGPWPAAPGGMDRALPHGMALATLVWMTAFTARLPDLPLASPILLALLIAIMAAGAALIGWVSGSITLSTSSLLVAGLVNCLLVGSAVHSRAAATPEVARVTLSDWAWIPGSLLAATIVGAVFGAAGAFARRSLSGSRPSPPAAGERSQATLGAVILGATLCLMSVGGLVTSLEVGLAVPDWPTSYGYNMFLFPFTKMVGGIYYEHAHRLIGSLVGLQTLTLCAWLWIRPPRLGTSVALRSGRCPRCRYSIRGLTTRRCPECGFAWSEQNERPGRAARFLARWPQIVQRFPMSVLGSLVLLLVVLQGVLGGQRVTMVNAYGHAVADVLAVVHACAAQLFLLAAGMLTFFLFRLSRRADEGAAARGAGAVLPSPAIRLAAVRIGLSLVALSFCQTVFGAITRHFGFEWALLVHVFGALAVVAAALVLASVVMMHSDSRRARLGAGALIASVAAQVLLGAVTWWMTTRLDRLDQVLDLRVAAIVSSHVVLGAVIVLLAWLMTLMIGAAPAAMRAGSKAAAQTPDRTSPRAVPGGAS